MKITHTIPDASVKALRTVCRELLGDTFPQVKNGNGTKDDPKVDPITLRFADFVDDEVAAAKITAARAKLSAAKTAAACDKAVVAVERARRAKDALHEKRRARGFR